MNYELLSQLVINGLIVGTLYGVVAMCFVLIYKSTQIVNFAQGEFLLIGAWTCWALLVKFELPFYAGFLLTLVFMVVFGILLQVVVLRPMIGEPIISVLMVTIGLSMFFQAAMSWMFGGYTKAFPQVFASETVPIFGLQVQTAYVMSLVISVVIMIGFYYFFKYSKTGLAMRATAFDQQVAQSLGISVKKVFAASWAISAVVSAMAGVVVGMVNGVSSALSFFGIKVFPVVILGGLDSIIGAIVGGLIIGVLENLAEFIDSQWLHLGNMYSIAPFYALVVILMIKPYGLFGTRNIERI
jgi:branched-chain amino acid transport system permease protein